MNGSNFFSDYEELVVRVVDEEVLCDHVPGDMYDLEDAFYNLQEVLRLMLEARDSERTFHRTEVDKLCGQIKQARAAADDDRRRLEQYKVERDVGEQASTLKLSHSTSAQLETSIECNSQLQAENGVLKGQLKEAETAQQASDLRLSHTFGQLQTITDQCSKLQTEKALLEARLTEVDAQLNTAQEFNESFKNDSESLTHRLEEIAAQKGRTLEDLEQANSTVVRLEWDLKLAKDISNEPRPNLRWAKFAFNDTDNHVRASGIHAAQAQTKRQRAKECLEDEREAKRRFMEHGEISDARRNASIQQAERSAIERQELEDRLRVEVDRRKEIEELLTQANAKLGQVVVTDSLIAAFLKMERCVMQVLDKEVSSPASPSACDE